MTTAVEPKQEQEPVVTPDLELKLPANAMALAWLNCFSASGKDENRPLLNRTLALEVYHTLSHRGIQLVGCDGTALFRTFVACSEDDARSTGEDFEWPTDQPTHKLVVMDTEGFALSFFRTLLTVTNDEDHGLEMLHLATSRIDREEEPALGGFLCAGRLTLTACGQRIDLKLYDGHYPNWRKLELGIDSFERVDEVSVAPRLLGLLAKLKGIISIDFKFRGDEKAIDFVTFGALTKVCGVIMPRRKHDKPEKAKPETAEQTDHTDGADDE